MIARTAWLASLALLAATPPATADVALVGGTVISVADYGNDSRDLRDATVILRGRTIAAVGPRASVAIPAGARVIDVSGQFLIPGLIDGFAAQRSQGQANAHLAMGVTTIVGLSDDRRGLLTEGNPQPHIRKLEAVTGYDQSGLDPDPDTVGELRARGRRLTPAELSSYVDGKAWDGYEVLLLMYPLDIEQVRAVVAAAKRHHLATIGELGHTSYVEAAQADVRAFVHLNRIASELAPGELRLDIANDPFPSNRGPLRRRFQTFLASLGPANADVRAYATALGKSGSFLMPTIALFVAGNDLDRHNPWATEIGPLIDPHDVHLPLDPKTGRERPSSGISADVAELSIRSAKALIEMQATFVAAGNHYLAGSGTTAFGVLPGDGLQWEMKLLTRIGLTPRQALAAATSNFGAAFGWNDRGQIAPERLADIVVTRADPTRDIDNARSIVRIFLAGEELDRAALLRVEARRP